MSSDLKKEYAMYLHEMGLSEYETSVYLSLLQQGTGTANEVANNADIPQSRVYDVLDRLEEKGFTTVQPGRPKRFGAVEPKHALNQYTTFKRKEFEEEINHTRRTGSEFLNSLEKNKFQLQRNDEVDVFWSYKGKSYILEHGSNFCKNANESIRMITKPDSFQRIVNHHGEILSERADHGVDVQIVVPVDGIDEVILDAAKEWSHIRNATGIEGRIYLYDKSRVLLAFHSDQHDRFVAMSTESSQMYKTLYTVFDLFWNQATDDY